MTIMSEVVTIQTAEGWEAKVKTDQGVLVSKGWTKPSAVANLHAWIEAL